MPPGTVIRSFAAPAFSPRGLAWDGRALWSTDSETDRIYQINPITGTVIRDLAAPGASTSDLAWDGRTLWACDFGTALIYQIDPITGTVIRSFAAPAAVPTGLTWDGLTLWHCDFGADRIYQINPVTETVIRDFAAPAATPHGLAWDGHSLWLSSSTTDRIYQINPITETVIRSFGSPNTTPVSLAWDGRTLWHADRQSDLIYQLSVIPGASYADRVLATGPIAYWPQWEAAGTISFDISGHSPLSERDGAYTGVTLGQPGIGDGRTAPLFDGANDFDDVFTANFQAAFNGDEGSLMAWARVSAAGVWTDGSERRICSLTVDGNNLVLIRKSNVNNTLHWRYRAGGVAEQRVRGAVATADWINLAITWSAAADEVRAYFNGIQEGAIMTVLGAWVGNLAANQTVIGASSTVPGLVWDGYLAHVPVWDYPLSPATVLSLAVL